jgi:hypothetical protein
LTILAIVFPLLICDFDQLQFLSLAPDHFTGDAIAIAVIPSGLADEGQDL